LLAAAAGGDERTLLGLAGYGDLLASVEQTERPEVLLGRALAGGKTLEQARGAARQRVEAVDVAARVIAWANANELTAPIVGALEDSILKGRGSRELLEGLLTAPSGSADRL
jgi:glycerol-3-phosphate dehydrogenase (NAD(P)+)